MDYKGLSPELYEELKEYIDTNWTGEYPNWKLTSVDKVKGPDREYGSIMAEISYDLKRKNYIVEASALFGWNELNGWALWAD